MRIEAGIRLASGQLHRSPSVPQVFVRSCRPPQTRRCHRQCKYGRGSPPRNRRSCVKGLMVAPATRDNKRVACERALSLRAKYLAALEAEENTIRAASRPPKGADGITLVELREKRQAAARELLGARRLYWEHLEGHGCGRRWIRSLLRAGLDTPSSAVPLDPSLEGGRDHVEPAAEFERFPEGRMSVCLRSGFSYR